MGRESGGPKLVENGTGQSRALGGAEELGRKGKEMNLRLTSTHLW